MNGLSANERLDRARAAQTEWANLRLSERPRTLARLRRQIAADREHFVNAIVADTGKPALDALAGDVLVTLEHLRFYERHAARLLASRAVDRSLLFYRGCRFSEHFEPHGIVLIFGPGNYPLQLSLVPAVTSLYAGNAVVLKVSERAPRTARAIEEAVMQSGLPTDLLQVVCVSSEESGAFIKARPDFVFFTGSSANGKTVAAAAAAHAIPSLLELGGSDAAIVFADCDVARTLEGIAYGAFSNAGQVCVGVKRLYIEQPLYNQFVTSLVRRTAALRIGAGHDCDLGQLQTEAARRLFDAQVQDALHLGAKLETTASSADGKPVILSNVPPRARLLNEEAFGPVLCVQAFTTEREAVALANGSPFALGASVWTRDLERGRRITRALNAGNCSVNDVIRNIANPQAAFGGNAASGYGRYHGAHGLHAFSRVKTIMENRSSSKREINWFPFTRKNYDGLDSLIALRHSPRGVWSALRRAMKLAVPAAILALALTLNAQAAHLVLQVHLPADAHGPVAYLVFKSPDGFPQDKTKAVVHGLTKPVGHEGVETIDAGELPPGHYAVSAYLDENSNGKLDSGLFGIPKEPVGVSNNPPHRMGPPRFQDCVFTLGSATQTLSINLVRP
jgi:acyl-CoA reductase-like NAD-dependent aldehyde dehydrogenase/uncharacterized protein (DUF2141 family)